MQIDMGYKWMCVFKFKVSLSVSVRRLKGAKRAKITVILVWNTFNLQLIVIQKLNLIWNDF